MLVYDTDDERLPSRQNPPAANSAMAGDKATHGGNAGDQPEGLTVSKEIPQVEDDTDLSDEQEYPTGKTQHNTAQDDIADTNMSDTQAPLPTPSTDQTPEPTERGLNIASLCHPNQEDSSIRRLCNSQVPSNILDNVHKPSGHTCEQILVRLPIRSNHFLSQNWRVFKWAYRQFD